MNFIARYTEVFAFLFLIFANFAAARGQSDSVYTLPAGTRIMLSMDAEINSKFSSVDDTFTSRVSKPIVVDDVVILQQGTVIEGRVTRVSNAGYGGKNGRMQVHFETIRFARDRKRIIDAALADELEPGSTKSISLLSILGGTAAGALIGAASGKENGTMAGAGIGAGAGSAVAFLKKGRDVSIGTDEIFEIVLKSEVTLPASDY